MARNRLATRSMLLMTRRPSATTAGSAENECRAARAGRRRGWPPTRRHRDAAVGVLQREHVVDAVAGHRHDVAARLQRLHHRPLLVRRDPAEHGRRLEHVGELATGRVGQLAGVDQVLGAGEPGPPADCADGARVVAGDHLQRHALLGEVRERLRRVGADHVLEQHQRRPRRARRGGTPRCERLRRTWRAAAPACPRRPRCSTASAIGVVRRRRA